ncbi:MAG: hypothetical protein M5U26_23685 [Planctomycetota bacterium]|nr:hypothetical protein [Planctomycetota bacterium]
MRYPLLACLGLLACLPSRADTIVMKNGEEIEGEILKQDDEAVTVKVEFGTIEVQRHKIREIEPDTPEKIEARRVAAEEKRKFEEAMRAKGLVEFRGKWMRPEDQEALEKKEADALAKKKVEEAKKLAAEEKKKAEEAKKAAANPDGGRQLSWAEQYLQDRRTGFSSSDNNRNRTNRNEYNDRYDRNNRDNRANRTNRNNLPGGINYDHIKDMIKDYGR